MLLAMAKNPQIPHTHTKGGKEVGTTRMEKKLNAKHLRGKLLYNLCLISLGMDLGGVEVVFE